MYAEAGFLSYICMIVLDDISEKLIKSGKAS